ncbi:hypothetical protein [Kineococcus rhizosphaerae]|uniref:hypothetical protein n=1 Tax=Kineococcus rhizosphaerae TaxID=559628 RepID=UPI000D0798F9|nr:hypothetical protein [Kineococcus rhizosphaerae]
MTRPSPVPPGPTDHDRRIAAIEADRSYAEWAARLPDNLRPAEFPTAADARAAVRVADDLLVDLTPVATWACLGRRHGECRGVEEEDASRPCACSCHRS